MPQRTTRSARLEARISLETLATVRRAAGIQGRSVGDFVVSAAEEAAPRTVAELEVIRLSRAAQEKFAALISHPPAPVPALKKAFDRHRKLIVSDGCGVVSHRAPGGAP